MAHPIEIRERAVTAVEEKGVEKAEVVTLFDLSLSSLNRWLKQKRERGHLEIGKPPGAPVKLGTQGHEALQAQVKAHPEATLDERVLLLVEQGHERVGRSTIHRMLVSLNITRKKKRTTTQKEMNEPAGCGGGGYESMTRGSLSLSMRVRPTSTCKEPTPGQPRGHPPMFEAINVRVSM